MDPLYLVSASPIVKISSPSYRYAAFRAAQRAFICLLALLFITNCVPNQIETPTYRTSTPRFIVSRDVYRTAQFDVEPPPGWRVIVSSSQTIVFAAPDNCALIEITINSPGQLDLAAECVTSDTFSLQQSVMMAEKKLLISGIATSDQHLHFEALYNRLMNSLSFHQQD